MADKSMKAVIWAEVDPRGVQKGVAAANQSLESLNRTASRTATATSVSAAVSVIQGAYQLVSSVVGQVDRRMQEVNQMAARFSPEARTAQAQTKVVQMQRDMAVGQALGLDVAAAEKIKQRAMMDEAQRAGSMVGGVSAWESLKQDAITAWDKLLEIPARVMTNPVMSFNTQDDVGRFWFGGATGGDLASMPGDTRGMPYDQQQTELLRQIAGSLKGGK